MNKIVVVSVNLIMTERRRRNASSKKPVTKKDFSPHRYLALQLSWIGEETLQCWEEGWLCLTEIQMY